MPVIRMFHSTNNKKASPTLPDLQIARLYAQTITFSAFFK